MKDIAQVIAEKEGNQVHKILTYDWIFSAWYEKLILMLIVAYSLYNILRLFL